MRCWSLRNLLRVCRESVGSLGSLSGVSDVSGTIVRCWSFGNLSGDSGTAVRVSAAGRLMSTGTSSIVEDQMDAGTSGMVT